MFLGISQLKRVLWIHRDLYLIIPIVANCETQNLPQRLILADTFLLGKDLLHEESHIELCDGEDSCLCEHAVAQKHRRWLRKLLYLEKVIILLIVENLSGFIDEGRICALDLKWEERLISLKLAVYDVQSFILCEGHRWRTNNLLFFTSEVSVIFTRWLVDAFTVLVNHHTWHINVLLFTISEFIYEFHRYYQLLLRNFYFCFKF